MSITRESAQPTKSHAVYEPAPLEVAITLALGLTVLSPYYRGFVRGLDLRGDERVLDYGSGAGVLSRHIAARLRRGGGHLDCVDISRGWQTVIRRTLRRFDNVGYHLGHIAQLGLPEAAYDRVVIHFVLHEVAPDQRSGVMQALARTLKSGGRIVLREPTGEKLTAEALQDLGAAAGLTQVDVSTHRIAVGSVYDAVFTR